MLKLTNHKLKHYDFDEYVQPLIDPTLKISISQFCNSLKSNTKGRLIKNIEFDVYNSSLTIRGLNDSEEELSSQSFGDPKKSNPIIYKKCGHDTISKDINTIQKYYSTIIRNETIKSLAKLIHLNKRGLINVYCECDNIIRVRGLISTFGSYIILISKTKPE